MTLTDFLLARIDEDEVVARWAQSDAWGKAGGIHGFEDPWPSHLAFAEHITPARVLAECEAKRRIVERCADVMGESDPRASLDEDGWVSLMWETMYDLALPYADHDQFQEEWRP